MNVDLIALHGPTVQADVRGPLALATVPADPKTHNLRQAIVSLVNLSENLVPIAVLIGVLIKLGFVDDSPKGRSAVTSAASALRREGYLAYAEGRLLGTTKTTDQAIAAINATTSAAPSPVLPARPNDNPNNLPLPPIAQAQLPD